MASVRHTDSMSKVFVWSVGNWGLEVDVYAGVCGLTAVHLPNRSASVMFTVVRGFVRYRQSVFMCNFFFLLCDHMEFAEY